MRYVLVRGTRWQTWRVSSLDYSAALDAVMEASPRELVGLIRAAAAPIGAEDIYVYLADFQGVRPAARAAEP